MLPAVARFPRYNSIRIRYFPSQIGLHGLEMIQKILHSDNLIKHMHYQENK